MEKHEADFLQMAKEKGLPTTEEEVNSHFNELREKHSQIITNNGAFGPFWRFVKAVATTPVKWLVDFLIYEVFPQSFLKTATGRFVDIHAWSVGLERKLAQHATGQLHVTRESNAGDWELPAGVLIQSSRINGNIYSLRTTEPLHLDDGQIDGKVNVSAVEAGEAYNLGSGYYTSIPVPVSGLLSVTNHSDWLIQPGTDKESDFDLKHRVRNQFLAQNQWHTDAVYRAIIADFDGIMTDNIFFEHDAPRGPGTANIYIFMEQGNASQALIGRIQSKITDEGNHGHGDDVKIYAMPETTHNIEALVWFDDLVLAEEKQALIAQIKNFIRCAFRENTNFKATQPRPWGLFSFSTLGRELHEQYPKIKNLVFNEPYIESQMNVPRLGTLKVSEYG